MKTCNVLRGDGSLFISRCAMMTTPGDRMKGLLGHTSLPDDEALWFPHETSVHTFFMKFSIDVAFLDRKGRVIALYHSLKPWRHTWIHLRALGGGTLEAAPGLFLKSGVQKGEELKICPSA